jgi:hypothetical protein
VLIFADDNDTIDITDFAHPVRARTPPMRCRFLANWILAASLIGLAPGMLLAQFEVLPVANESAPRGQFFGVLGQVARPGVYELPGGRQTLNDLIEAAGGLTTAASSNLRIVRSGGQTFFQPRVRVELHSGDLIVCERRRAGMVMAGSGSTAASGRDARDSTGYVTGRPSNGAGTASEPARSSEPETADAVQLGVIGLLDRLVVIAIPSEQATLQNVLATLRQSREGARQISLLRDGSQHRAVPLTEATQTVLTTGTVIVFDAKSAQVDFLPKLPQPVRWTANEVPAAQALITTSDVAKPATVEGMFPRTAPQSNELTVPPDQTATVMDVTEQFQTADEPVAHAAADESSSPAPLVTTREAVTTPTVDDAKAGGTSWVLPTLIVLGSVLAVAGLIGFEFLRRPALKSQSARAAAGAVAAAQPDRKALESRGETIPSVPEPAIPTLLDELITNCLPIVIEPVVLPSGVRIHGRPIERSDEFQLRFDAAHSIPQPHVCQAATVGVLKTAVEPTAAVQNIPRRAAATPPGQRIDTRHPRSMDEPKLLDRVLAELDRSKRASAARSSPAIAGGRTGPSHIGRHLQGGVR